jgi:hypothetical protein
MPQMNVTATKTIAVWREHRISPPFLTKHRRISNAPQVNRNSSANRLNPADFQPQINYRVMSRGPDWRNIPISLIVPMDRGFE